MKKLFAFAIALMLLLALSSVAFAKTQHKDLLLTRIVIIDDDTIITLTSVKNNLDFDFNNGKVVVSIPELGLRAARNLDLNGGKATKIVLLDIPTGTPSGEYYLRIVVTNEDVKRVRHRLITI